jgi:hypothetical protein
MKEGTRMAKKKTVEGKQLAFGMEGKQVALLHSLINAIGIEIDESELKAQRFGPATQDAVRRLQILAGLKPTGKVDRRTQKLLDGALERLQATQPSKGGSLQVDPENYFVEGNVTDSDGFPLKGVTVIADTLDLRKTREMGRSKTDDQGHYRIQRAVGQKKVEISVVKEETGALDLRLRVLSSKGKTLFTTETYFHVTSGTNIPIAMGGTAHNTPPEFTRIGATLQPHLGNLHPQEFIENENFQDITFLAGTSGLNKTQVAFYSLAARLADTTGLSPEFFYSLFAQNVPPNSSVIALASAGGAVDFNFNAQRLLNSVLSTSDDVLAQAINSAVSNNVLPPSYKSRFQKDLALLPSLRTNAALSFTYGMGKTPIQIVLNAAKIPEKKQQKFVSLLSAKTGTKRDFWKALEKNPDFSKAEVATLHFSVNVGIFVKGHMPLVQKLMEMRAQGKISKSSDLARLNAADWKALLNSTYNGRPIGIPANFTAKNVREAKEAFAHLLERNFERAYPTTAFSARLAEDKNGPFLEKDKTSLSNFLDTNPKFNLFNTNVDRYLKDNPAADPGVDREALRNTLYLSKRLIKLASRYTAAKPLLTDGINSSLQIYAMGRSQFINKYKGNPDIGASQAGIIFAKAEQTYALALSLAMRMNGSLLGSNPLAIGDFEQEVMTPIVKDFPNLGTLFGPFDLCDCDPSRTVLSPAAYLVDLLNFLSWRSPNFREQPKVSGRKPRPSVKDILLERRPDLAQIKLNSANTNTVLPYIDLVNELLEEAIAPPADPSNNDAPSAYQRQTTLTTEELNANPEYVNYHAYAKLADDSAVFPWSLPFDLPLNEARAYLGQLGVDRVQLMKTFQKPVFIPTLPDAPSPQVISIAVEGLGLSQAEADIIFGTTGNPPWECWGLDLRNTDVIDPMDRTISFSGTWVEVLSNVRILLNRSGLTYKELTQLLNTVYINPQAALQLGNNPPDSCSLDSMTIYGFAQDPGALDRIHRFVRLMRRLDWDVYTLDSAITILQAATTEGANKLNSTFLRQLFAVKTAMRRFNIPVNAALALFGQIETRTIPDFPDRGNQRYSLYHSLFQNRAVLNTVDSIFDLNDVGTEILAANGSNPPMLSDYKPTLLGALEISDADLALVIDSLTDGRLTLANLSTLYRHVVLASGLGVSIKELISLKALFETEQAAAPYDPFDALRPELLDVFCDTVDKIRDTKFSILNLDYLLRHDFIGTSGVAADDVAVGTLLKSILDGLNKIAAENTFGPDPTGTETRRRLASLPKPEDPDSLKPEDVDSIMTILSGSLEGDPNNPPDFAAEKNLIQSTLGSYMDGTNAATNLVGTGALPAGQARYEYVLTRLLAYSRKSLGTSFIVQQLANALALPVTTTAVFVKWFPSENDPAITMLDDFLLLLDVVRIPSNNNNPITLNPGESGTNTTNQRAVPFAIYFTYYMSLDKAAKVIGSFGFTSEETDWLRNHGVQQGWLDLSRLPRTKQNTAGGRFIQWSRLADAAIVKKKLPSDGTPFTSLMELAHGNADKAAYMAELVKRTQWSLENLKYLCDDPVKPTDQFSPIVLGLLSLQYPEDYCSERALRRLMPAFALMRRLGISANVGGWIGTKLKSEHADSIKQSVKANYSIDQWLPIAKQLRDPLREQQRDALVAYLLVHPPDGVECFQDANDIYSHYLIDVEMSACQGTSRIVQAIAAIQLFVLRCILNVEDMVIVDADADTEWGQWRWMSRYRLWEANRKIFLYPENWIEPSLRKDKSPFMADLENDLLQNEVTKDTVEDALRTYLEKLDAVARLQVVGIYHEAQTAPTASTVSIAIQPATITLDPGHNMKFNATVTGAINRAVIWKADHAMIDKNGNYTAPSRAGTYTVYAYSVADPTQVTTATVTVNSVSIAINPSTVHLTLGGKQTFTATVGGSPNTGVAWSASSGSIDNGIYTAPSAGGTYTVMATSVADKSKSATATVIVAGVVVKIDPPDAEGLFPGGQQQFTATVSGTPNQSVTWAVSGNAGFITADGLYTAPWNSAQGWGTVTATSVEDPTSRATVWVTWAA